MEDGVEPDLDISVRTGRDFRDDGSFWRPLREAFRFELPTEVLRLIHEHYIFAEFALATTAELSTRSDQQLLLDLQRLQNAYKERGYCMCLCGIVGGCCYNVRGPDGEDEGYAQHCPYGEVWMQQLYLDEEISSVESECEKRGLVLHELVVSNSPLRE